MITFLSFIAIALLVTILVLIGKTNELTAQLKDKEWSTVEISRRNGYFLLGFLIAFMVGAVYCFKKFAPVMIPKSASIHGVQTDNLFYVTLAIIMVVFVLTHVALFYFAYRYNESKGHDAYFYPHNNKLEIVWTVIPTIVLTVLIAYGMREWYIIFDRDARDPNTMVVEVTAKQFNWMLRYPGLDGKFGERIIDKEHVSPTNELGINWKDAKSHDDFMPDKIYLVKDKPVLMKLGAQDVLHSFYLPHFRVKMDCVPGIPTEFYFVPTTTTEEMKKYLSTQSWWQEINPETQEPRWKTFKYELACAELCGSSHYGMQREVVVVTQEEYNTWMKAQTSYYETVVKPTLVEEETKVEVLEASVATPANAEAPATKKSAKH
jgi:cytochrome c oxidase subunit 2